MKRKSLTLAVMLATCVSSLVLAAPQTQWQKGEFQVDLGAWDVQAEAKIQDPLYVTTDKHWNFVGGVTYGLTDKWGLQYAYYGLKPDMGNFNQGGDGPVDGPVAYDAVGGSASMSGHEQEINLLYSLNKNVAVYGGWNRIQASFTDFGYSDDQTNNVAQLGVILKAPITDNFGMYAKGAVGTKKTTVWEAGLDYNATKDLDINLGYRNVNTEVNVSGADDHNITFKGFITGISYRFGGGGHHAVVQEAPAPVYQPVVNTPAPVVTPAPVQKLDYYIDSIHFDTDMDTPMASEQPKLDHFVAAAKANPNNVFKLVGNTDSQGNAAYNENLSKRRVENIANYAANQGVPASQLKESYHGQNKPVNTNDTDQGRADNRRVDIYMNK